MTLLRQVAQAAIGLAIGFTVFGCDGVVIEPPAPFDLPLFELRLDVAGAGSILGALDRDQFSQGATVDLQAEPNPGSRFDHWEGDESGDDPMITVTMDKDVEVIAVFVDVVEFTIIIDGEGTVDPGTGTYDAGTVISFVETPADGWRFDGWGEGASGTDTEVTLAATSDMTVVAHFVQVFNLSTEVQGEGAVSPDTGTFDVDSEVTLTATPAEGWRFDQWDGDVSGTEPTIEVTVNSDINAIATFVQVFDLEVTADGSGVVAPGSGSFDAGSLITLTAVPDDGWFFAGWSGDASGDSSSVQLIMDSDHAVVATFVALAGQRTIVIDGFAGIMTLAVKGTEAKGIWRFGAFGFEMQGTIAGTQVALTVTRPTFAPATIIATVQPSGSWTGTINGSGFINDFVTADPVTFTGFTNEAAGYRAITFEGVAGKMVVAIDGAQVRGNLLLGSGIALDLDGTIIGNQVTLTASAPQFLPATLAVSVEPNGTWTGTLTGSGLDGPFVADPPVFP